MSFITYTGKPQDPNPPNTVIPDVPCDPTVYVGAWVRMNGGIAVNAQADTKTNANVIGVVESKSDATTCTIRFLGISLTIFSMLDETKEYFLSATVAGEMTTTVPTLPGQCVIKLGQPFTTDRFLVLKEFRAVRS